MAILAPSDIVAYVKSGGGGAAEAPDAATTGSDSASAAATATTRLLLHARERPCLLTASPAGKLPAGHWCARSLGAPLRTLDQHCGRRLAKRRRQALARSDTGGSR